MGYLGLVDWVLWYSRLLVKTSVVLRIEEKIIIYTMYYKEDDQKLTQNIETKTTKTQKTINTVYLPI